MTMLGVVQARFPAPEFDNYQVPLIQLENIVADVTPWRILLLALFLVVGAVLFYKYRSRKGMLFLSLAGLTLFGFVLKSCPCPVGMFQNIAEGVANGTYVPLGILLLFTLPLVCALFYGRVFCGGACPLGALQELLHWHTLTIPLALDRVLRLIPILLLLLCSACAACGLGFPLCYLEPYLPIFVLNFATPLAILSAVFIVVGLFISRPFCRFVCPYGALLRFCTLFAVKKPVITIKECVNCKLCEQGCPNGAVLPPEPDTSAATRRKGSRRLSTLVACIPLVLFLGGLLGYFAAPAMSSMHRDVRLLRDVETKQQTLEVEAFEAQGSSLNELKARAVHAQNKTLVCMTLCGMLFGACVMAELIAESRRRREENSYSIDASLCFCCGRCYAACPLERKEKTHEK